MGVGDPDSGWVEDPPSTLGAGVQHQPQRAERGDSSRGFTVRDPEGNLWSFDTYRGA